MKDIFQNSFFIFGWLGVPQDQEEAILAVKLMGEMNLFVSSALAENRKFTNEDFIPTITNKPPFVQEVRNAWEGIVKIMKNMYWSRTCE